jgi:hypothetical protein
VSEICLKLKIIAIPGTKVLAMVFAEVPEWLLNKPQIKNPACEQTGFIDEENIFIDWRVRQFLV